MKQTGTITLKGFGQAIFVVLVWVISLTLSYARASEPPKKLPGWLVVNPKGRYLSPQRSDLSRAERIEGMRNLGKARWKPWWYSRFKPTVLPDGLRIPDEYRIARCVPFSSDWQLRIAPTTTPVQGQIDRPVKATMARNEFEPATFGVYAMEDLRDVKISVSPLRGKRGPLDAEVDVRIVEYWFTKSPRPMRLWPTFLVDIPKGFTQEYWIIFRTEAARSIPGTYKGSIRVEHAGGKAELPLELEVLDIELLHINDCYRLGCFDSGKKLPGLASLQDMHEHNLNMVVSGDSYRKNSPCNGLSEP